VEIHNFSLSFDRVEKLDNEYEIRGFKMKIEFDP